MGYGVMVCVWWAVCGVWCDRVCGGQCVGYGVMVCVWWAVCGVWRDGVCVVGSVWGMV